jgi:hypothetical protein
VTNQTADRNELNTIELYEGTAPHLFISYSHKDTERVTPLIRELARWGVRVWYDTRIPGGSQWREELAQHLRACTCVLAMLSRSFQESPNCFRELNFALDQECYIIPVYLEDLKLRDDLAFGLAGINALKYNFSKSPQSMLETLYRIAAFRDCCKDPTLLRKICGEDEAAYSRSAEQEQRDALWAAFVTSWLDKHQNEFAQMVSEPEKCISRAPVVFSIWLMLPALTPPPGIIIILPAAAAFIRARVSAPSYEEVFPPDESILSAPAEITSSSAAIMLQARSIALWNVTDIP